jgi:hypothetical protein
MRILALAIFVIGTVSIGPAAAQTYDPAYPVPARVRTHGSPLLRLQLHDAASVQRIGVGPLRLVRDQSILCGRRGPRRSSTASPRLLTNECIGRRVG